MAEIASERTGGKVCGKCGSSGPGRFCPNCGNALDAPRRHRSALGVVVGLGLFGILLYLTLPALPLPSLFGSDLDLSIEVPGTPSQRYGFVLITNLGNKPIELREVRINRRTDDACVDKDHRKLATGERAMVGTGASVSGLCGGSIVRVTVITDQGQGDYTINW